MRANHSQKIEDKLPIQVSNRPLIQDYFAVKDTVLGDYLANDIIIDQFVLLAILSELISIVTQYVL